jgi:outer membrane protein OmpA-like peptidoglycan-associated protein
MHGLEHDTTGARHGAFDAASVRRGTNMALNKWSGIGTALAVMSGFAHPALAAGSCRDFDVAVVATAQSGDVEQAEMFIAVATKSGACTGGELGTLGRKAAAVAYAKAVHPNTTDPERALLLDRALRLGRIWPVLATLGDRAKAAKQHDAAATLFQEALDDIRNVVANPTAPPAALIASLVNKAEAESLLAANYVKRVDRSGAVGGLACQTYRGFTTKRTALPVEFKFNQPTVNNADSAEALTAKGRLAVDDLFAFLSQQGTPAIHLIGHTDPIASDDFNMKLSERRAATLQALLVAKGYAGQISISGKGRTEPFQADDPGGYTEAERHQLDRRVELARLTDRAKSTDQESTAACSAP